MIKEAMEYIVGLSKKGEITEVDGHKYSSDRLQLVTLPMPAAIKATTLTAMVDYLKSEFDVKSGRLTIHVVSPSQVNLLSELRPDAERNTYMTCQALTPNNIYFDRFMDTEQFNIMLQSSFVNNDDRSLLLKVTGCVKEEAIKQVGDDGVSQAATIKTGVASVENVVVPNPVILAPYRTFPEIIQPESRFVFRMQSGPKAALYEADGGAWRNKAMESIKVYLKEALKDMEQIHIIS